MAQENRPSGLHLLATAESTRHLQPTYKTVRDTSPDIRLHGVGVLFSTWELVSHDLQLQSRALTSGVLKTTGCPIPRRVDPARARKVPQDSRPLFAPKRMKSSLAVARAAIPHSHDPSTIYTQGAH